MNLFEGDGKCSIDLEYVICYVNRICDIEDNCGHIPSIYMIYEL